MIGLRVGRGLETHAWAAYGRAPFGCKEGHSSVDAERDVLRRRSKLEVYYHLVWATLRRDPRLSPDVERQVYRCITCEAERLRCRVLALNGMPDHVHLVVCSMGVASPASLAKQVKGVSSAMLNEQRGLSAELFRWQGGFSLGRPQVDAVVAYVQDQKRRHDEGTLWPEWEETDEAAPNNDEDKR